MDEWASNKLQTSENQFYKNNDRASVQDMALSFTLATVMQPDFHHLFIQDQSEHLVCLELIQKDLSLVFAQFAPDPRSINRISQLSGFGKSRIIDVGLTKTPIASTTVFSNN